MARVVTPGGRVGDDASLDRSPGSNWVEQRGGLPKYIRVVANALMRNRGFTREHAIRTAINAMRKWAAKSTNPSVKAAAAAGAGQWESLKLSALDIAEVLDLAVADDVARQRFVLNLSAATPAQARATVRGHYPPDTLRWMQSARWTRQDVPLSAVTRKARPGAPRDPRKVAAIADHLRGGRELKPVLLVARPGRLHDIADGYHRVEAHRELGHRTVPALVAHGTGSSGPWQREMHARKLNLSQPTEFVLDLATAPEPGAPTYTQTAPNSSGSSGRTWDESKHPRTGGKFAPKGTATTSGGNAQLTPEQRQQISMYQAEHGLPITGELDVNTAQYAKEGKARRDAASRAKKGGGGKGGGADAAAKKAEADAKKRQAEADRVARQQEAAAKKKEADQLRAQQATDAARLRDDKAAAAAASRQAAEFKAQAQALFANAARLKQQAAAAGTIAAQQVASSQVNGGTPGTPGSRSIMFPGSGR